MESELENYFNGVLRYSLGYSETYSVSQTENGFRLTPNQESGLLKIIMGNPSTKNLIIETLIDYLHRSVYLSSSGKDIRINYENSYLTEIPRELIEIILSYLSFKSFETIMKTYNFYRIEYPKLYEYRFGTYRKYKTKESYIYDLKYKFIYEISSGLSTYSYGEIYLVTGLSLKSSLLKIPEEVFDLTELEDLSIKNSKLKELPKEIGKLVNLNELDLFNNLIKELPEELFTLKNLQTLNLGNNQINKLSSNIGNLENLVTLELSNNRIRELPKEIDNLKKLKILNISHNFIQELPKEIGNLSELVELRLKNNLLQELPKEIEKLNRIQLINLGENPIKEWTILPGHIRNIIII